MQEVTWRRSFQICAKDLTDLTVLAATLTWVILERTVEWHEWWSMKVFLETVCTQAKQEAIHDWTLVENCTLRTWPDKHQGVQWRWCGRFGWRAGSMSKDLMQYKFCTFQTLLPQSKMARIHDSRMRSEGFSFNSGGLEVGVVFAQCCFGARNRSQAFVLRSLSLTVGRRSQNVTESCVVGRFRRK